MAWMILRVVLSSEKRLLFFDPDDAMFALPPGRSQCEHKLNQVVWSSEVVATIMARFANLTEPIHKTFNF